MKRALCIAAAGLVLGSSGHEPARAAGEAAFAALQAGSQVQRVALPGSKQVPAEAVLTHLAPAANAWLLLSLPAPDGKGRRVFHLENADPGLQRVTLDAAAPGTLLLAREAESSRCVLWPGDALAQAVASRLPQAPLCGGRLYLRNAVAGQRSLLEASAEFLRDHVWRGEQVIGFVKRELYRDAHVERAASAASAPAAGPLPANPAGAPPAAVLGAGTAAAPLLGAGLGIPLAPPGQALWPGRWAAAAGLAGVWVSAVAPGAVARAPGASAALDEVESQALAFLVAFDLGEFDLGFALGTEHPRLGWSPRVRPAQRGALPGPDGFDSAAPLVRTGTLPPPLLGRVVASFTGGFKREHGAFSHGALAAVPGGSHYGFVEQGVVFSRLQPGLMTLFVTTDGTVGLRRWRAEDEALVPALRHARQNGVALVEPGADGRPAPGPLVAQWGAGNWSGSADERLRTLRAGVCLVEQAGRRFLVYGYFSSATPRAMARVFGAYGCSQAMHLDMNALEHTYLALYPRDGTRRGVAHLVPGMAVLDKSLGGELLPRFLGLPDNRDFFYLTARREARREVRR
ncbi:MAG: hypothetical protein C0505_15825 [Leptothrix sp. (in: Bacteria)]|nr:hypothetical protein [Leptothrix sp. (in: b-proteobacteria)]